MVLRVTCLILIFIAFPVHATKPCHQPTETWFIDKIVNKTDWVIYGEVVSYSNATSKSQWTLIKPLKILQGKPVKAELRIEQWAANDFPRYTYEKGSRLLFYLRSAEGGVELTRLDWRRCIPSLWEALSNGQFVVPFSQDLETLTQVEKTINGLFSNRKEPK